MTLLAELSRELAALAAKGASGVVVECDLRVTACVEDHRRHGVVSVLPPGGAAGDPVPSEGGPDDASLLMGTVNGVGDLIASLAAGLLMQHVSLPAAFLYAAITMLLGTALLARLRS